MNEQPRMVPANDTRLSWTVEAFARFWENPDLSTVGLVLTDDVTGYWPRRSSPVRGRAAYTNAIAELLVIVPDFRGRVVDHCGNEDRVFVHWEAQGTGPAGPTIITGVDRVVLRDGLVVENRIYSDHPIFEALADRLGGW